MLDWDPAEVTGGIRERKVSLLYESTLEVPDI